MQKGTGPADNLCMTCIALRCGACASGCGRGAAAQSCALSAVPGRVDGGACACTAHLDDVADHHASDDDEGGAYGVRRNGRCGMATEIFKTAVELQLAELRGETGDVAVSRWTCMDAGW